MKSVMDDALEVIDRNLAKLEDIDSARISEQNRTNLQDLHSRLGQILDKFS